MATRIIDPKMYGLLLEAYRVFPGNHAHASRTSGAGRRFCKRAYEQGWDRFPQFPPIKGIVEKEAVEAFARQEDATDEALRERQRIINNAREQAVQARAEEASLVRMGRKGAIVLLGQSLKMLQAAIPLGDQLVVDMAKLVAKAVAGKTGAPSTQVMLSLLERVSRYTRDSARNAQLVMEMGKFYREEAINLLTAGSDDVDAMTDSELAQEMDALVASQQRSLRKGRLVLVPDERETG